MKVIDEKGRLFGKINVIDLLVALFILSLVPMFYFGYKIAHQREIERQELKREAIRQEAARQKVAREEAERRKEFVELEVDCIFMGIKSETIKMISVGDKAFDQYGEQIGEIISLGEPSPYVYLLNIGSGRKIKKEPQGLQQLPAILRLRAQIIDSTNMYYQDRQIINNAIIEFKTDKYSLPVTIKFKETDVMPEIVAMEKRISTLEVNTSNMITIIYQLKGKIESLSSEKKSINISR